MSRQELSYALYQHDAACRVISRLKKERDEARSLLSQAMKVHPPIYTSAKRAAEDVSKGLNEKKLRHGIPSDIIDELSDFNVSVSQERKKRTRPLTLAPVDDVERYTQLSSHPLHKTTMPGILSVDIHYSKELIATGGIDSNAVVFDHPSSEIISTLTGHTKKVNCVKIVPQEEPFVITGSADATVRIWKGSDSGNYECKHILKDHQKAVQPVTIHASNKYLATASLDKTWCFYDLSSGLCLAQATDPSESSLGYMSSAFHPDGLLLGAGTSQSLVRVWDLKSQENLATLEGHIGAVTSVSFSENGFVLATAADDGVKLWDLRYLRNFQSFSPYDQNVAINSVHFDHSNSYLAVGGVDARVYQIDGLKAEWNCIKILPDLSGTGNHYPKDRTIISELT